VTTLQGNIGKMGPLSGGDTTFYMKMMPALVISNEIYSSLSHFFLCFLHREKMAMKLCWSVPNSVVNTVIINAQHNIGKLMQPLKQVYSKQCIIYVTAITHVKVAVVF